VSRWVTWHGFALNVTPEPLEKFGLVVPCGIRGVRMTSLRSEGLAAGMDQVRSTVARCFGNAFGVDAELRPGAPWYVLQGGAEPPAARTASPSATATAR
jgi:lipoate-protein ligase B